MKEEKIKGTLSFFRNFENAIMLKNEKRGEKKAKGTFKLCLSISKTKKYNSRMRKEKEKLTLHTRSFKLNLEN